MRRVVILTFDGGQSLDVVGPFEVFAAPERTVGRRPYAVEVVAPVAGAVRTMSGVGLVASAALADVRGPIDTFVIAGGNRAGIEAVLADDAVHGARGARGGVLPPRRVRLLGGVRARGVGAARRPPGDHPLGGCDAARPPLPAGHASSPTDLRARRTHRDLRRGDRGHRSRARPGGGGPRRRVAHGVARQLVVFLKRPGGQAQFSAGSRRQAGDRDDAARPAALDPRPPRTRTSPSTRWPGGWR